jgi:drug/metabolite transporter (DMT)-like permease
VNRLLPSILIVTIGCLVAVSQLVLRHGVRQMGLQKLPFSLSTVQAFVGSPPVLVSMALGLAIFVLYAYLLSVAEITFVAPIVNAIFYLLIFVAGATVLGEHVTGTRAAGAALLLVAIWLLTRAPA